MTSIEQSPGLNSRQIPPGYQEVTVAENALRPDQLQIGSQIPLLGVDGVCLVLCEPVELSGLFVQLNNHHVEFFEYAADKKGGFHMPLKESLTTDTFSMHSVLNGGYQGPWSKLFLRTKIIMPDASIPPQVTN